MIIAPRESINIADSNVSVVEDGVAVFSSDSSYATGDIVQVNGDVNKKYRAIKDGGEIISPELDVNADGVGEYWYQFEPTNYAKAFDELTSSKCTNEDSIYYKFNISDIDLLMISGVKANTIRVVVTNLDSETVLLDETEEMLERNVIDWFDWTYAVPRYKSTFFKILPMAYNATLEVWIENDGSIAEAGHIAYGRSVFVGLALMNPSPKSSRRGVITKTRDEWGNIVTRRGARYKRMTISCLIDSVSIDMTEDILDEIVDIPCIFAGDDRDGGYKSLLIYGELKDHDMPIQISKTQYQLEVEGYI